MTVFPRDIPRIPEKKRIRLEAVGQECYQVNVSYVITAERDIPAAIQQCKDSVKRPGKISRL